MGRSGWLTGLCAMVSVSKVGWCRADCRVPRSGSAGTPPGSAAGDLFRQFEPGLLGLATFLLHRLELRFQVDDPPVVAARVGQLLVELDDAFLELGELALEAYQI